MSNYNKLKKIIKRSGPSQIIAVDHDDECASFMFFKDEYSDKLHVVVSTFDPLDEVRMPLERLRKILDEGEKMAKRESNG